MTPTYDTLKRQMLLINKLERSCIPLHVDDILTYLEHCNMAYDYSYPVIRNSRMRLLQRDIKSIADIFGIEIQRIGKSHYTITSRHKDGIVRYNKLFADFDLLTSINPDTEVNRYIIPERNRYQGASYLPELLIAIKERRVIEFDYVNYRKDSQIRHHEFRPHYLKEDQGLWYMIGYSKNQLLVFALDRIRNLEIQEENFVYDEELDIEKLFLDSYGIWVNPSIPTEVVELRFDALDGNFIKAKPFHPSQKIISDTEQELRITLEIQITNDFVMALLSRARSVEVISPLHLRQRIRDTLSEALKRNS